MARTPQEQLRAYLKDAHALEQMSLITQAAAKASKDPELRRLFSTTTRRRGARAADPPADRGAR